MVCQAIMDSVACMTLFVEAPSWRTRSCSHLESLRKMEDPTREQISHRAYELWEKNGKPEGRDQEFYHQAEKELKEAPPREPTGLPE